MNKPNTMLKNNSTCKFCFRQFTVENLVRHNKFCKEINITSQLEEMKCGTNISRAETFIKNSKSSRKMRKKQNLESLVECRNSSWSSYEYIKWSLSRCSHCKKKFWNNRYGCSQYMIEYYLYPVKV